MKCYTYYNRVNNRVRSIVCLMLTLLMIAAAAVCPAAAFAQVSELTAIDGGAAILVDSRTGTVLYEQNADQPVAPASTTKIMTALLVVESVQRGQVKPDDLVELTEEIMHNVPSDASRRVSNSYRTPSCTRKPAFSRFVRTSFGERSSAAPIETVRPAISRTATRRNNAFFIVFAFFQFMVTLTVLWTNPPLLSARFFL